MRWEGNIKEGMSGGDRRIRNLVLIGRGEGMGLHGLAHVERMIRRKG